MRRCTTQGFEQRGVQPGHGREVQVEDRHAIRDGAVVDTQPVKTSEVVAPRRNNAIAHNLPEHGTVWVTTSASPGGVVLTVENTGAQQSPQVVATLVEPFVRGAGRARTDHAGVGLGLAIVERIARAHDGTLTLTPRPDGGLSATVQLPAAPAHTG
jgi:two-component system sensor histidine kinase VanS